MYKRFLSVLLCVLLLAGCGAPRTKTHIAATTGPVAQFAELITAGTGLTVTQLISDSVSCLHDYALSVRQMEVVSASEVVLISGAGLETFMEDILENANVVDCSAGVTLLEADGHAHEDEHTQEHDEHHHHDHDPHIWLDPSRASQMAENICVGLSAQYPQHRTVMEDNLRELQQQLLQLDAYGKAQLSALRERELITFHDGFGYFAAAYDLELLAAIEAEPGSETSAKALEEIAALVETHSLAAIFTEVNGSNAAAGIIQRETGVPCYPLDMAMGGSDYFTAMIHNFDILKEALQ